MISQNELIKISKLNNAELSKVLNGRKWERVFWWQSAIRKALAEYGKNNKFDDVQMEMIRILAAIEKWLWKGYAKYHLPRFIALKTEYARKDKQYALREIKKDFDALMKRGYR